MAIETPEYPLHLFNLAQTKLWVKRPDARRPMVVHLIREYYRGGFGILSAFLDLIAVADPRGVIRELKPPYRRFQMWQAANAPNVTSECACLNFFDPEVGGRWRERGPSVGHHPFCQFDRTADAVFNHAAASAVTRLEEGKRPQARPDEWMRMRVAIR
jgi:hypothetical protein